jgi:type I restriction enzyme S subunit
MSFPRYPAYKSSGVEWLGEVPEHWEVLPLKRRARLLTEKTETTENPVALENIEGWTGRFVETESEFQGEGVAFQRGDILFGKLRPYLAKVYLASSQGQAVGDFHVIHPDSLFRPKYLKFQLLTKEVIDLASGSTYGAKMPRASWDFLGSLQLSIPPLNEQEVIATFLDRETAKIDALITEQQRLIELLQEKRQAVISHAVTKGLNPDAPMKDSGVEWLGEVPEHWGVGQLRRFTRTVRTGRTPDESDFIDHDHSIPWFTPGSFNDATLTLEAAKHVSNESVNEGRANIFSKDAVLVVGIGATLGKVGIPGGKCSGNQQINAIESSGKLMPRFLGLFLSAAQEQMRISSNASTLGIMNQQKTKELVVNCPPLMEQEQIIFHSEKGLGEMLEMSEQCQHVVELLQERRSALISAAVTGQIDVRGLVPETEAA